MSNEPYTATQVLKDTARWFREITCRHLETSPQVPPRGQPGIDWVCDACGKVTERHRPG